jgi:hypothetical protein
MVGILGTNRAGAALDHHPADFQRAVDRFEEFMNSRIPMNLIPRCR